MGAGNGDGLISVGAGGQTTFAFGEANLFYVHLARVGLISGSYSILGTSDSTTSNGKKVSDYLLPAKIGGEFYFNVWNGGPDPCRTASVCPGEDGNNYISLANVPSYFDYNTTGIWRTYALLSAADAWNIDTKVDDGMPQSGHTLAFFLSNEAVGKWAGGEYAGTGLHVWQSGKPTTAANPAGAVNCYDNGNVAGQPQRYTVSLNNNTCALSFRM